jgi:hypothetical protein
LQGNRIRIPTILLAAVLSACGSAGPDLDRAGSITAAAQTVAKAMEKTDTPTPQPSPTAGPTEEATLTGTSPLNPTATRGVVATVSYCDLSAFVSDVTIPDGSVIDPGDGFTKTWKFKNTGECKWTTSYSIAFVSGNAMDGKTTALAGDVDPGDTIDVSVELTAPTAPGTYTGYWRLKNAAGDFFGDPVYVQIVVPGAGTATVTPTQAATEAEEPSNTPSPTPEPTQEPTQEETTAS